MIETCCEARSHQKGSFIGAKGWGSGRRSVASWAPEGVNRARSPQGNSPVPALCPPLAQPEQQVLGALQVWAPPVGTIGERLAPVLGHQRLSR